MNANKQEIDKIINPPLSPFCQRGRKGGCISVSAYHLISWFSHSRQLLSAIFTFAVAFSISVSDSPIYAWGGVGHRLINEGAIYLLPPELKTFYLVHKQTVVKEAVTPDIWKESDSSERFRHYIDLDYYGDYPFHFFPAQKEDAIKKYGREKVKKWGTLPWRIEELFEDLVLAFQRRETKKIVELSAWLGHYVADGHVPLHTTKNYDGQLTGHHGIHKRFEDAMVKKFKEQFRVRSSSPAVEVRYLQGFVFDFLKEGYLDIEKILKADLKAKQRGSTGSPAYYSALHQEVGGIAKKRISKASHSLASMWYTAWIRAGKASLQ